MSELFYDPSSIDYPIVDADAHVNEPPELWQERVPQRLRERAPKVVRTEKGEFWSFEDGKELWPVGLTAVAGMSYLDFKPIGMGYADIRPGSFETGPRLADMDADGIYAQVLYPSVTLRGANVYSGERDLQLACVRAYNDWIGEFCEGSDGRLIPQGIIPTTGVEDAGAELERSLKVGHRGVIISSFPNGSLEPREEDESFWGLAQEADVPVAVHIGSFMGGRPVGGGRRRGIDWSSLSFLGKAAWTKAGGQTLGVVCDLLFAGIYDRFPRLKILLVEANIGWIPTLLEQADDMFRRYRWYSGAVAKMTMPSEIFMRHFWATFMLDSVGVEMRHRMNLRHIMWSTDYPHSGSDWPDSRITLERVFRGVPRDEVKLMLHTNCKELYHLDHIPQSL
ncbi:MAG: amidohydrolase family protein [Myxococcota bacterium]